MNELNTSQTCPAAADED